MYDCLDEIASLFILFQLSSVTIIKNAQQSLSNQAGNEISQKQVSVLKKFR